MQARFIPHGHKRQWETEAFRSGTDDHRIHGDYRTSFPIGIMTGCSLHHSRFRRGVYLDDGRADEKSAGIIGAMESDSEFIMDSLSRDILEYLESTHAAKSTAQIASSVRARRPEVARALLALQRQGRVRSHHGLWKARDYRPQYQQPADQGTRSTDRGTLSEARGDRHTEESGRDVCVPTIDQASRWVGFRRLCAYYADCVRLAERPRLVAYAHKQKETHLELQGHIDWRALASSTPAPLRITDHDADTLRRIAAGNSVGIFYLGAPVEVYISGTDPGHGDGFHAITPVFVQRVVLQRSSDAAMLIPIGKIEINHGWLESRVRGMQKRRVFLDAIGLAPTSTNPDDEESAWLIDSFEDATRRLSELIKQDRREYLDLNDRPSHPSLSQVDDSGVYNRAVLFAEPRLQFAQRLHGELQKLAYEVSDENFDQSALAALFPHGSPTLHHQDAQDRHEDIAPFNSIAEYQILSDEQMVSPDQRRTRTAAGGESSRQKNDPAHIPTG